MCKFWDDEYSILPVSVYEDAVNIRNGKDTRDQCTQVDPDLQSGSIGDNFAQDKITRNQYTQVDSDLIDTEIESFCQVVLTKTEFRNRDNENQDGFLSSLNTNEEDFEEENEPVLESSPYPIEMNQSDEVEILLGLPSFNHDNTHSSISQSTQSIYTCNELAKNDSNENHSKIKSSLQDSEILPKDESPFSCNFCGMKYKLNHHFKRHQESCRFNKLLAQPKTRKSSGKCIISTKKRNNQLEIEKHQSSTSREKKYQCETCGKLCYTTTNLKTHKMTHTGEKPFKCRFCSYCSNLKGAVAWHERTHTDERPFQCDTCGKTFKLKCHLDQHVATHFDARNFKCEQCDATFRRNSALLLHRKTHTEEKPFSCYECDSTFRLKKELVKHQILHLTDNPLTCNVCGSIFLLKEQLKQHLKSHQDLPKPFECHFCFKTFKHNCQLSQHLRGHSNDKPFKCQHCSSAFTAKANLRRHELGHLKKLDKVTARNLNYDKNS